jgi:hypothetical protein
MTFGGAMSSSNRVGEVMKEKTEVTVQTTDAIGQS